MSAGAPALSTLQAASPKDATSSTVGLLERENQNATGYLTGQALVAELAQELATLAQSGEQCTVLYVQIDHQNELQAALGVERITALQHELASLVGNLLKEGTDLPGHWHEGFAIVLPRTNASIANNLAEQIRITAANLGPDDTDHRSTLSIGIASAPDNGNSADLLLNSAREAALRAESEGGNSIRQFGN